MREAADRLLGRVGDGPNDPGQATRRGKDGALGIDRDRAGALGELPPLDRVVDDAAGVANDGGERAGDAKRLVFPEDRAVDVDHASRRQERARRETRDERAGEPERDEPPFGEPPPSARARAEAPCPGRGSLLDRQRADERQRRVQARLRTVSRTLSVVAIVAAGSKPEWMPQCSQRWSLPGP